jgi:hypothetical protein
LAAPLTPRNEHAAGFRDGDRGPGAARQRAQGQADRRPAGAWRPVRCQGIRHGDGQEVRSRQERAAVPAGHAHAARGARSNVSCWLEQLRECQCTTSAKHAGFERRSSYKVDATRNLHTSGAAKLPARPGLAPRGLRGRPLRRRQLPEIPQGHQIHQPGRPPRVRPVAACLLRLRRRTWDRNLRRLSGSPISAAAVTAGTGGTEICLVPAWLLGRAKQSRAVRTS